MHNISLSFPEFRVPRVEIADLSNLSLFEKSSYIPGLSTIKGAGEVLIGIAGLVASIALAVFTTIIAIIQIPRAVIQDIREGYQPFGPFIWNSEGFLPHSTFSAHWLFFVPGMLALSSCYHIGRGLIESVPVIGNLTIAYLDDRIRIINT